MDRLLGKVMEKVDDPETVLMVISDHGFTNFRRGVNLNTWLRDEGYLVLKDGATTSGDWFELVDWSRTKAFSMGLTGLFINRKGREKSGIVQEGAEYRALCAELQQKLQALIDPSNGQNAVRKVEAAWEFFDGPYRFDAPDLLVGYEGGYRNSWECATGSVTTSVFTDNTKSWSGDHCVDPSIVPGVFLCNRPIQVEAPHITDIPASVLRMFGQTTPSYMRGRMLFAKPGEAPVAKGMLDPKSLPQSGSAPGARIFPEGERTDAA
jgi:predicted AlkP superfamily phosphohydrolase/phosphomutase